MENCSGNNGKNAQLFVNKIKHARGNEQDKYSITVVDAKTCKNKWNHDINEKESGASIGSSNSSSSNSTYSSMSCSTVRDSSFMSSISSNTSSSSCSSSCVSSTTSQQLQQQTININKSFQKHLQNLTTSTSSSNDRTGMVSPHRADIINCPSPTYSTSSSLRSLDKRLCKTLPRKLTKGILSDSHGKNGTDRQTAQRDHKNQLEKGRSLETDGTATNGFNHIPSHQDVARRPPILFHGDNANKKRNSNPDLDTSSKCLIVSNDGGTHSSFEGKSAQRHSCMSSISQQRVVPPPPQYKGVHFAPNVEVAKRDKTPSPEDIPTEGLPTGPAKAPPKLTIPRSTVNNASAIVIPKTSETVPIVVKNMSDRPPMDIVGSPICHGGASSNVSSGLSMSRSSSSLTFNGGSAMKGGQK